MDRIIKIKIRCSFIGSNRYIRWYRKKWRISKSSIRRDMPKIELIIGFRLVIKYAYISAKTEWRLKVKMLD
jgi:hypothetical protein